MTDWVLRCLAEEGRSEVYALTTTIAELAQRMSFERVERKALPPGIRASRQFAGLCPATAVALRRRLTAAD